MTTVRPVLTPCIGVCTLDPAGYCDGCFRSGGEIAGWLSMNDAQRLHMMDTVLPAREARQAQTASVQDASAQDACA
jgi:predicted Fe-S protein YdhL (DUF1289 family)